jgi:hypothetical protein
MREVSNSSADDSKKAAFASQQQRSCDLSIMCPVCCIAMHPEHAHYKCPRCGYRDSCCF